MDGGFIKVHFSPWQRSLFLPPAAKYQGKKASANREASQTQQACDWLMREFMLSLEFHTFKKADFENKLTTLQDMLFSAIPNIPL